MLAFAQVECHCAYERPYLLACDQRTRRCHPILHTTSVLVPLLKMLGNGDTRLLKKQHEADRSFLNIRSCSAGLRVQHCQHPSPWWANGVQRQFAACSANCTNAGCTAQLHMAHCVLHCILRCAALHWAAPDQQRQPEASRGQSDRHAHILPDKYQ